MPNQTSAPENVSLAELVVYRPPLRPDDGKLGRNVSIRANHFAVEADSETVLHLYSVKIFPEISSRKISRKIFTKLGDSQLKRHYFAYDGQKNLYATRPLTKPDESKRDFDVTLEESGFPEFKVEIRFVKIVHFQPLYQVILGGTADCPRDILEALDVIMKSSIFTKDYNVMEKPFFNVSGESMSDLGYGIKCIEGFYQTIHPTQMGLSLNLDVSTKLFYGSHTVSSFVLKYLNITNISSPLPRRSRAKVRRALKGVVVDFNNTKTTKRYRVIGVSTAPTSELRFFRDRTADTVSVVDYFEKTYNINLKYACLPALQAGSVSRPVYLPMELCKIIQGQRYCTKLNPDQMTVFLKETCKPPAQREHSIRKFIEANDNGGFYNFGVQVSKELSLINGRVLSPPMLQYFEGRRKTPNLGSWDMNNEKYFEAGTVVNWACVSFSWRGEAKVSEFCQGLVNVCRKRGMIWSSQPVMQHQIVQRDKFERTLRFIKSQSQLDILIVILPESGAYYGEIKRICDTELGIVSQCCRPEKVFKFTKQHFQRYLENLALKINVKVGGQNTILVDAIERAIPNVTSDQATIIFGADQTHYQPREKCRTSISAVVCTMDWPGITNYRAAFSVQHHRDGMIRNLFTTHVDSRKGKMYGGMIRELLIAYRKANKSKPRRIIFYRDGVSESEFNKVVAYEIEAIKMACASLEDNYMPPITFVVVQKRHHTRLFPVNEFEADPSSGNILAGTVVDTEICHPTQFDFYLCSHASLKGTSRPIHYHVLYDENNFTADGLQKLTNDLCYTYASCTS